MDCLNKHLMSESRIFRNGVQGEEVTDYACGICTSPCSSHIKYDSTKSIDEQVSAALGRLQSDSGRTPVSGIYVTD